MYYILLPYRPVYGEFVIRDGVPVIPRDFLNGALRRMGLPIKASFTDDAVAALLYVYSRPFYPWVAQIEAVLELRDRHRGVEWVEVLGEMAELASKYASKGVAVVTREYMDVGMWSPSRIEPPIKAVLCRECIPLADRLYALKKASRVNVVFLDRETWKSLERSLLYDMQAGERTTTPRISKGSYLVAAAEGTLPRYIVVGGAPVYAYPL